ncbi:MAG: RhuM family protein [Saprospiraceae bacterium]
MSEQIEIYQSPDGTTQIEVHFEQESVWLSQAEMSTLFGQTKQNISLHINNCFKEKELERVATVKKSLTVRKEGHRTVRRTIEFYNLDVIISVGYRVKSKEGTQFRIWATQRLRDYLIEGYAINEKRLAQKERTIKVLKDGIHILNRAIEIQPQGTANNWLTLFAQGLSLLDDYDHENLDKKGWSTQAAIYPSLAEYQVLITEMCSNFASTIFGKEKDDNFRSSIAQIEKGFKDRDFYPSLEEKAAMLLYLIVKNHSFVDGNKRIAAACFLKFLEVNQLLFNKEGALIISNEALASLTLFIASSKPEEMETVKRLTISVLNRNR